jgi:hypothetical protein
MAQLLHLSRKGWLLLLLGAGLLLELLLLLGS